MQAALKNWLKQTPFYSAWFHARNQRALRQWRRMGMPLPPPGARKQAIVQTIARQRSLKVLVETGTYLGDMIYATKNIFERIISIELSTELWTQAVERFKTSAHVQLLHGDSAAVLPEVLKTIEQPSLFWLDGHYSGGVTAKGKLNTPIVAELTAIFRHPVKEHYILIDDARCFTGQDDYPSNEALGALAGPEWRLFTSEDVIHMERESARKA